MINRKYNMYSYQLAGYILHWILIYNEVVHAWRKKPWSLVSVTFSGICNLFRMCISLSEVISIQNKSFDYSCPIKWVYQIHISTQYFSNLWLQCMHNDNMQSIFLKMCLFICPLYKLKGRYRVGFNSGNFLQVYQFGINWRGLKWCSKFN